MKRYAGVTLIELAIALAITGIVSGGMFAVFNTCLKSWDTYTVKMRMSTDVNILLNYLTRDVRESLEIIEAGGNYIVLKGKDNKIYGYSLRNNKVYRVDVGAGVELPLLENVSQFNILSSYDNRFFGFSITQELKGLSYLYRTGIARRVS